MEYIDPFKVVDATIVSKDYSLEIAIAAIVVITVVVVAYELSEDERRIKLQKR